MTDGRIPVTVLTGFLGAGKTTLLNRILTEHHGQRIAVIENEFGEVGVDQALVVDSDEEIFEMNNGCICCTVRGDLIRILAGLRKRRDRFDRVVVETTGLANPAPVAQTFFVDEDVRADYRLDAIVTLVDAAHVALHLDDSPEAIEQIAFADVIVLNKVDLAPEAQIAAVEARVRAINGVAALRRARMAEVPIERVLDVGGFDLDRALEHRPGFLEPERPFEWGGVFHLSDDATLVLAAGPDPSMAIALAPAPAGDDLAALADAGEGVFAGPRRAVAPGERVIIADGPQVLRLDPEGTRFPFDVPAGRYALFTEHRADEYDLHVELGGRRRDPHVSHAWTGQHQHDTSVKSVALVLDRPLDETKLNKWLAGLLRERGADIFRMKGILDVAGQDRRYVFQGVHMLLDGRPDRPWGPGPRTSELVFIGRNLDRAALESELRRCVA